MAVTYRSIATATGTNNAGSITINEPSGALTDDLLVACISYHGTSSPTTPSGWTQVANVFNSNTATGRNSRPSSVMYFRERGTGATNYTFSGFATTGGSIVVGGIVALIGTDSGSASVVDGFATQNTSQRRVTGSTGDIIPTVTDGAWIGMASGSENVGATYSNQLLELASGNVSMTEVADFGTTAGDDIDIMIAYYEGSTTSDDGPMSYDRSVRSSLTAILALFKPTGGVSGGARSFAVIV